MWTANPFTTVAAALIVLFFADAAQAQQVAITFISAHGSDASPCTRAAPCASLQRAINATSDGGEVDIVDGGDFGAATIGKALAIVSAGAGPATVEGIVINAVAVDEVILRGLNLRQSSIVQPGVSIVSAVTLVIDHCAFHGYFEVPALSVQSSGVRVRIIDTVFSNSGSANSAAVLIQPPSSAGSSVVTAQLERVQILNSTGNGIRADASQGAVVLELHDVTVDGATGGSGIVAVSASSGPRALIVADDVTAVNNAGYGLRAVGPASVIRLRRSTISNNGVGVGASNGGVIASFSDNLIHDNISGDGAPTMILPYD